MTPRAVAVVLLAAGRGERLGANQPKAFVELAGKSLLEHSIYRALATENLRQLIIAVPESHLAQILELENQLDSQGVDIPQQERLPQPIYSIGLQMRSLKTKLE